LPRWHFTNKLATKDEPNNHICKYKKDAPRLMETLYHAWQHIKYPVRYIALATLNTNDLSSNHPL